MSTLSTKIPNVAMMLHNIWRKAEAEVMPSSSLVEFEVEIRVEVEVGVEDEVDVGVGVEVEVGVGGRGWAYL